MGSGTLSSMCPNHRMVRSGSRSDIPREFDTSGFVRIAAFGLTSQGCHNRTFPTFDASSQKEAD